MIPSSMRQLLCAIAHGKPLDDAGLATLRALALLEAPDNLRLSSVGQSNWSEETALVALYRTVSAVIPTSVIDDPESPCRSAIETRLQHLFGYPPDADLVEAILAIAKNIQQYRLGGRRAIGGRGLDLESAFHKGLLKRQHGRCACCGYRFLDDDLYSDEDPEESPMSTASDSRASIDRSPERFKRQANLDHRYPVYLAGTTQSNQQILCATCNAGKSDRLAGFEGKAWFNPLSTVSTSGVSSQLFYMVLNRDGACRVCQRGPRQVELRVVRRDPNGLDVYTNLTACCVDHL